MLCGLPNRQQKKKKTKKNLLKRHNSINHGGQCIKIYIKLFIYFEIVDKNKI